MVEGEWVDKGAAVRGSCEALVPVACFVTCALLGGGAGTASLRATSSTRREQAEGRAKAGDVRLLSTALAKKKKKKKKETVQIIISDIFDLG
jgi:hypothetical protein